MTNPTLINKIYISPYERKRGRPKKYTPEEALKARRKTALKYYYDNFEHCKHLKKVWYENKKNNEKKKIN